MWNYIAVAVWYVFLYFAVVFYGFGALKRNSRLYKGFAAFLQVLTYGLLLVLFCTMEVIF
jgi:hypothetical protein